MILISCLSSKQPYLSAGLSSSGPYHCLGPCLPIDEGGGVEERHPLKAADVASAAPRTRTAARRALGPGPLTLGPAAAASIQMSLRDTGEPWWRGAAPVFSSSADNRV